MLLLPCQGLQQCLSVKHLDCLTARQTLSTLQLWYNEVLVVFLAPCSFAVVIQQLPNPLRDAICIFYLVLRGLDTVEDDMAIPVEDKLPALLRFHDDIYDR